jgi:hypothetical protein
MYFMAIILNAIIFKMCWLYYYYYADIHPMVMVVFYKKIKQTFFFKLIYLMSLTTMDFSFLRRCHNFSQT